MDSSQGIHVRRFDRDPGSWSRFLDPTFAAIAQELGCGVEDLIIKVAGHDLLCMKTSLGDGLHITLADFKRLV